MATSLDPTGPQGLRERDLALSHRMTGHSKHMEAAPLLGPLFYSLHCSMLLHLPSISEGSLFIPYCTPSDLFGGVLFLIKGNRTTTH